MKKKLAAILLAVITLSSLGLVAGIASALPWIGRGNVINYIARANMAKGLTQRSWIRINGIITEWGETDVNGLLHTQARTAVFNLTDTRQLASASAVWTTNTSRPINAVRAKENFTYSFYGARLINASVSELNYGDDDFFLSGTWNLYNVTSNVTIITNSNGEITKIHRESDTDVAEAYGELSVTDNWTKFTLAIDGYEILSGSVIRSRTGSMQFNPFKITSDLTTTTSNVVSKADLATIAKNYRAMPGWGNYDQSMDFNGNYKIDIADLATVAANM